MELTITDVDYAPGELADQCPVVVELLREMPGVDRPDYWLGQVARPISWLDKNIEKKINYLVLASRWEGTKIEPNIDNLPIGIAYVTDETLLNDEKLDFKKCSYVAIGTAYDTTNGKTIKKQKTTLVGTIGKFFGVGNQTCNIEKYSFKMKSHGRSGSVIISDPDGLMTEVWWKMSEFDSYDILFTPLDLREWQKPKKQKIGYEEQKLILRELRNWLSKKEIKNDLDPISKNHDINKTCRYECCNNSVLESLEYCAAHFDDSLLVE